MPTEPVSIAVALADKLDTLVGFWAIDEKPTGSKDPMRCGGRRLGVIRIVVENGVRLGLLSLANAVCFGRELREWDKPIQLRCACCWHHEHMTGPLCARLHPHPQPRFTVGTVAAAPDFPPSCFSLRRYDG